MMVPLLPDLYKEHSPPEMVHHFLVARGRPPFDGVVELPSRVDDPERDRIGRNLLHLRNPVFFDRGEMDVTPEFREFDPYLEAAVQELDKSVQEMPGFLVAAMNQRVLAVY